MTGSDPEPEDEVFSEIVRREFKEDWRPERPAPEPFDLNLFDDDESYRAAPASLGHLSRMAQIGLILAALGLICLLLALIVPRPPSALGWLGGLSWLGAAVIGVYRLLRRDQTDDDDSAVV
ncbi:MAG: hypothetical protein LBK54_04785 [Propionibacteriaceae bacterium]|jgi:hypothetical protein|nr:hypothetical protein [Propionibacteriaceae bacterium]